MRKRQNIQCEDRGTSIKTYTGSAITFLTVLALSAGILAQGAVAKNKHGKHWNKFPSAVQNSDFRNNGIQDPELVELGLLLFFDKELSGNRNISCATCHHPLAHTADGLSLSVGEGAAGISVTRNTGTGADAIVERVPRNAPHVFNLGAKEFRTLFHDGRVAEDPDEPTGFLSPAGDDLPPGLDSALAVQAMFPVTSATEMAGQAGENSIADAAAANNLAGPGGVWEQLATRLKAIPDYVTRFTSVFSDVSSATDITYVHAANAMAAFEEVIWRFDNSPFDQWLRGKRQSMSAEQIRGMYLFYRKAGCASCHSGKFQTDHKFHAIAMPQIGPGKGVGVGGHDDFGREAVTGDEDDRYKFRTPTLRNVALTGPWGHDGAYATLEAVVRHHLSPVASLHAYDTNQAVLPSRADLDAIDFLTHNDSAARNALAGANELAPRTLSERDVAAIIAFLQALTDPAALDQRGEVPQSVPSGLPVFD